MKAAIIALFALVIASVPALADDAAAGSQPEGAPSDESLRELLEVTGARKLVEDMPRQVDSIMAATLQNLQQGQPLSPEQRQSVDLMRTRMSALFKEEFDWNALEPVYMKIYRDSFSQSEVDGLMSFYRTPAGQAVIHKLPLVMQNMMSSIQQRMATLMPRIQQLARDTVAEIQAQRAALDKRNTG